MRAFSVSSTASASTVAAVGLVVLVLCLVAAGYGFEGWAWIAGMTGPVLVLLGAALVIVEHGRVRASTGDPFATR